MARRPVLNLGPFCELGLFCFLRRRGVRVPVPWRLVRTPRVSRHLAAAPQENTIYTATHIRFLSDPPATLLSSTPLDKHKHPSAVICVQIVAASSRLGWRQSIPVDIPNLTRPADRYWPEIPDNDLNLMS
jgi:hypothetical protein